ncbi:MAG: lactate utilization protein, partial [Syntrophomonadaceae bacterium]|nr:lactate utilization protein [Syntrophomonadaceae bacterium]
LLDHNRPGLSLEEKLGVMRRQLTCDLFLASANAITLTGSIISIDGNGNRVASTIFGPRKVILVAGRNKLVGSVDEGLKRIKAFAAPLAARRLDINVPCAKTGFCIDCNTPDRICTITMILERKPRLGDVRVLVVNEELGF